MIYFQIYRWRLDYSERVMYPHLRCMVLLVAWNSPPRLEWAPRIWLPLPYGLHASPSHIFMWVLRLELRFSCLRDQHFTARAISRALGLCIWPGLLAIVESPCCNPWKSLACWWARVTQNAPWAHPCFHNLEWSSSYSFALRISLWGAADPLKKAKATKQQLCKLDEGKQ